MTPNHDEDEDPMIPWRRHEVDTRESRKFGRIPLHSRTLAFGVYELLCDLTAKFGDWDTLIGSRGDPWTVEDLADKLWLDVDKTREIVTYLANAELIDGSAWREAATVKIPMLIIYAAEWFRRKNHKLVAEHCAKYGISQHIEVTGRPARALGSTVARGDSPSLPGVHGDSPPTRRDVTRRDVTRRDVEAGAAGPALPPSKRIRFDRSTGRIVGITDADLEAWGRAYQLVDITATLPRIEVFLRDNRRKNINRTVTNWLKGDQEKAQKAGRRGPVKKETDWSGAPTGRIVMPAVPDPVWAGQKSGRVKL